MQITIKCQQNNRNDCFQDEYAWINHLPRECKNRKLNNQYDFLYIDIFKLILFMYKKIFKITANFKRKITIFKSVNNKDSIFSNLEGFLSNIYSFFILKVYQTHTAYILPWSGHSYYYHCAQ